MVQSLRSGERKTLLEGGSHARYVPTGHLVFARGGVLFAVPFDLKRLEVTGGAVPIVEGVWRTPGANSGAALFSVSDTGSLIYVPGPAAASSDQSDLALIDRKGVVTPLKVPPGVYEYPRVSPDGTRLVFGTSDGKTAVISTYELSGASAVRQLTFEGNNRFPIWSGDGRRVAFQSDRRGRSRRILAAGRRRHRGAPDDTRPGHVAYAGVVVSRRQGPAVQRDEGTHLVALDVLAQGSESDPVRRRESFDASDQRDVLT